MQVLIEAKELEVTAAIRQFVNQQLSRKFVKLGEKISKVRVFLEQTAKRGNDPKRASVKYKVSIPGSKTIVVRSKASDLYKAIVAATNDLVRQFRKEKEKRLDKKRQI